MTAIWVCGALERARSERMRWQTTMAASSVLEMTTASAVPSWERRSSAASSAAAGAVARSMGAATAHETPAEMATPAMVGSI